MEAEIWEEEWEQIWEEEWEEEEIWEEQWEGEWEWEEGEGLDGGEGQRMEMTRIGLEEGEIDREGDEQEEIDGEGEGEIERAWIKDMTMSICPARERAGRTEGRGRGKGVTKGEKGDRVLALDRPLRKAKFRIRKIRTATFRIPTLLLPMQ